MKLGDVCEIVAKQVDPTDRAYSGLPHISAENIESGTMKLKGVRSAAEDGMMSGKYLFEQGDVLYSKLRPYLRKVAMAPFRGVCSADMYPLRAKDAELDAEFLARLLLTEEFTDYANEASQRARMPKLNREQLFAWQARLPPLAEQRRIAGRLREQMAEVARARATVQAQLAAAQALPAAVLRAHFTTPAALRWPCGRIRDIARVQSGYAFRSDWFKTEGIRLLRNVNIAQGRTTWDDTVCLPAERRAEFPDFELSEGDIILSLDRPLVSGGLKLTRLTANDVPALLLQRVGRFVIKHGVEADYLFRFLQTDGFIRTITAHEQSLGVPHVSPKQVEEVELPLPPLAEQRALAARLTAELSAATALRESLAQRLAAIERLPAALLRKAFRGGDSLSPQAP